MPKRKSGSYAARGMRAIKRQRASGGFTSKSRAASVKRIKKTILGLAENKREYLAMGWSPFNHDAGNGPVVGGYGHPNNTIGNNWLGTTVGDSKHQREGDSIFSKYIDYALQVEGRTGNFWNLQCRFLIVKGTGNFANDYASSSIADWFITDGTSVGSGNLLTQPIDKTKYTVLKDVIFSPLPSSVPNSLVAPVGAGIDYNVLAKFPVIRGRLKTGFKVQYKTGSEYPSKSSQRIQWALIPYADNNCTPGSIIVNAAMDVAHYFADM